LRELKREIAVTKHFVYQDNLRDQYLQPLSNNAVRNRFIDFMYHSDFGRLLIKISQVLLLNGSIIFSGLFVIIASEYIKYLIHLNEFPDYATPTALLLGGTVVFAVVICVTDPVLNIGLLESDTEKREHFLRKHFKATDD